MIPLITSRACPYSCTFCFHSSGRRYSERSLDDVFAEIDYHVKKYMANFIIILDEVFSPDNRRMKEFCERIKPLWGKVVVPKPHQYVQYQQACNDAGSRLRRLILWH
jgi:radical SAM superfamily enzyme YgiQ (UPF0313 family)